MEAELLRLREGNAVNKGLLAFSSILHQLAQGGSIQLVNYEESALTQLLSGGRLGGGGGEVKDAVAVWWQAGWGRGGWWSTTRRAR